MFAANGRRKTMAYGFLDIAVTPGVKAAQVQNGSAHLWTDFKGHRSFDRFTENEAAFLAERDSFYIATVSETGWPYVQHRGGPRGFLRIIDDKTLAFADFAGNRQYISLGNLGADGRVSLILMDYVNRRRLKIFAHAEVKSVGDNPELAAKVATPGYRGKPERIFVLHLDAFDWNCPQHITQRFDASDVAQAVSALQGRIAELEAENGKLRKSAHI
jgi:predicted pyridoxine 5'-phosphate oxidase superfamily flavin-nucleotide-binding protein